MNNPGIDIGKYAAELADSALTASKASYEAEIDIAVKEEKRLLEEKGALVEETNNGAELLMRFMERLTETKCFIKYSWLSEHVCWPEGFPYVFFDEHCLAFYRMSIYKGQIAGTGVTCVSDKSVR